jgi:hypothetical protein
MIEAIEATIDWAVAYIIFGVIIIVSVLVALTLALFAVVAAQAAWRWLARHTWRDVILAAERKALRRT